MAAAWLDERQPEVLHLGRGVGRPLWLGEYRDGLLFASTEYALEVVERYCGLKLRKRRVEDGTVFAVHHGKIVRRQRFRPPDYAEHDPAPEPRGTPGARLLPQPARDDRRGNLGQSPVGADLGAPLEQPLADQELERRPGAAPGVEEPVDLPLGHHLRPLLAK